MVGVRVSTRAQSDLDDIWLYIAHESSSIEIANRIVDSITNRFWLLGQQPEIGRRRDDDLRPGLRSFPVGEYIILYRIDDEDVVILYVTRGSRDLAQLVTQ